MILLEVLAGAIAAGLIARYNESNKLFWILFMSFVIGIAGQSVIRIATEPDNSDSKTLIHDAPTQSLHTVFTFGNVVTENNIAYPEFNPTSVVQEHLDANESFAVSECYVDALIKPPTITCNSKKVCLHISTHLDT